MQIAAQQRYQIGYSRGHCRQRKRGQRLHQRCQVDVHGVSGDVREDGREYARWRV